MSNFEPPGGGYMGDPAGVSSTPGAKGVDHNGIVVGRWKVAMFGCFDTCIPNTCMVMICPGVSVAQISKRLGLANYFYVLLAFAALYVFAVIAVIAKSQFMDAVIVVLTLGMVASIARLRWRVRFLFSLPGSPVEDCFYASFCGCCAIAQMATQVESYKPGSCHPTEVFLPRNTLEGYTFA